jgi:hypothetical protein
MGDLEPTTEESNGIEPALREIITASDLRAGRPGTVMRQAMAEADASLQAVGAELRRLEREGVVTREGTCLRWEGDR